MRVVKQVSLWASSFNMLSIANQTSSVDIDVQVERVAGQGMQPVPAIRPTRKPISTWGVPPSNCRRRSDQDVFLAVLDLSTDGNIALVFPSAPGAQEILAKRGTWTKKLRTTLPTGRNKVKDFIKVFATSTPVDFSLLTQGAVRGNGARATTRSASSWLQRSKIFHAASNCRPAGWATAESEIRVRR